MKSLCIALALLCAGSAFAADAPVKASADASGNHRYMVERTFPAGALAGLDTATKAKVNATNAKFGVKWEMSYANADKTKTYCVYDGPSEAAVRDAAKANGDSRRFGDGSAGDAGAERRRQEPRQINGSASSLVDPAFGSAGFRCKRRAVSFAVGWQGRGSAARANPPVRPTSGVPRCTVRRSLMHTDASHMTATHAVDPIGTLGQPWGATEVATWRSRQTRKRSYAQDVLSVIERLRDRFDVTEYGRLEYAPDTYPLFAIRSRDWREERPCALVTGGVHGYETSGVHGALEFVETHASRYAARVNLLVVPCVSPWAYERIHRWNADAIDPNRSFRADSPAQESAALMRLVAPLRERVRVHIDLHETTDSDESEFRPALAARDGVAYVPGEIPMGSIWSTTANVRNRNSSKR